MRTQILNTARCALGMGAVVLLSACASPSSHSDVYAADFTKPVPAPVPVDSATASTQPVRAAPSPEIEAARSLLETVTLEPGAPDLGTDDAPAVSAPMLVDAKVGDVNGRPIQASSFLEPLEARLRAEARRMDQRAWRRFARQLIEMQLDNTIEEELLVAEALELLPEPVREFGLRRFVQSIRDDSIRKVGGSATRAKRKAQRQSGQTLDELAEEQLDRELVNIAYNRNIQGRVHVSWHDIMLYYERSYGDYNPTPAAVFRRIRVFKSNPEAVQHITDRLAAGDDFATVAGDPANRVPDPVQRKEFQGPDASYTEIDVLPDEALNDRIRALQPGQWTGPLDTGMSMLWYQLVEIDEPDRTSLYEAQAMIENGLREHREGLERKRYVGELRRRASFTDLADMTERLLSIAEARYYPSGS